MAFVREYYPSDAIKFLNKSEGQPGMSGEAAHAMAMHLRHSPGPDSRGAQGLHQGVGAGKFAKRFQDNPIDDNGNYRINSGWLGKGDMAILLSQLLNSPAGQSGLAGLDSHATRVVVQTYFSDARDFHGKKLGGAVAEIRTSPSAPTLSYHAINPQNPLSGQLRSVKINKPTHIGVIRMKDIVGAVAVLDKVAGGLHVQTFYPLFTVNGQAQAEYKIGTMKKLVTFNAAGQPHVQLILG
jgi:hypothetical protein